MLILLDDNAPRGLARALTGHVVTEARERGWATFQNGDLLRVAEEAGFDVLVTADKNLRYQQSRTAPIKLCWKAWSRQCCISARLTS